MAIQWNKPLPNVDNDIEPFWDALKEHEFKLYRCNKCREWYWPFSYCRNDDNEPWGANVQLEKASGKGKVFTFNIVKTAFDPSFKDDVPYVYAMIELDEGPMIGSNIEGCEPTDVYIGMPVEVFFQDIVGPNGEEWTMPKFKPQQT